MGRLEGKVALVTGGSSGIGLATAQRFAREGAHVFTTGRFASANAVDEQEAQELHETFAVPASDAPLFQAAAANLNPWTEARVDVENPARGPLLILSGEKDNTVPWAVAGAALCLAKSGAGAGTGR